ncbi:hypothetical protein ACE1CD_33515 [Aerosakkonema sp. BLCC-F183]|uniref:hypothetical protein n=1 Tax=Aerosakkonema sp. BLCC-F183 TaxID=3342834 RepID=UPI0035B8A185
MSETPILPDPQKVKQTIEAAHRACQDMELAGLELQEVIELLEKNIREQRLRRLRQVS